MKDIFSIENLKLIISSPKDHPQQLVILIGIMLSVVFFMIIAVGIALIKNPQSKKQPKQQIKKSAIWFAAWLFVFLVAVSLSFRHTSSDSYCGKCHYEKKFVQSKERSVHKDVSCLSCHQRPGAIGLLQEKALLINRVLIKNKILEPEYKASRNISNYSCLQCHEDLKDKVIFSRGTRVAHKHIIDKGYRCTECHNQVAHGKLVQPVRAPNMADCMTCHDGKTAFNRCEGCHSERVPVRGTIEDYNKIGQKRYNDCTGCHTTNNCSGCHNMKIPHGPEFFNDVRGHATEARAVSRETCVICHKDNSCSQCHD